MKILAGLSLLIILTSAMVAAEELISLKCKDAASAVVFNGVIDAAGKANAGEWTYNWAISTEAYATMPRPSLQRSTGLTVKDCPGPYVKIFERVPGPGVMKCATSESKKIAGDGRDRAIFEALGLRGPELSCSAILSSAQLRGLPRGHR